MRKLSILFLLTFLMLFCSIGFAQSGRQTEKNSALSSETQAIKELSVREMFTQATNYALDKITELEKSGQPYSVKVHQKILQDQKQLAAKYASEATSRDNLAGEDFYYIGRLHWLATNGVDAADAFKKFLEIPNSDKKMMQTARSVVVVISAENKDFETAESVLSEYIKNIPNSTSELAKIEKQLAYSYVLEKKFELAAPHADEAFNATKTLLFEDGSRAVALSQFLDAGITSFEIQKELNNQTKAEEVLETMRKYSMNEKIKSHSVYYKAIDQRIKYMIETDRKPEALEYYKQSLKQVDKDFNESSLKNYIKRKLRKREPHYKVLGEPAPELASIDKWLPNKPQKLEDLRGKVIFLDFWATWCGPCLEAFPALINWHNDLKDEGLVILGVTRYYNQNPESEKENAKEMLVLEKFKKEYKLPYPFVVADNQTNQIQYGATSIPTVVLIDRKGKVRYVESGTGKSREKEIQEMILKLLAEK